MESILGDVRDEQACGEGNGVGRRLFTMFPFVPLIFLYHVHVLFLKSTLGLIHDLENL